MLRELSATMSRRMNRFVESNVLILEDIFAMSATISGINMLILENIIGNNVADIARCPRQCLLVRTLPLKTIG
jgi:hypothetical protein